MNRIILLVDHHKTFVMFMGIILKRMRFDFFHVNNGPDALGLIEVVQPDIVIVDGELPIFDGLETLPRLADGGPSIPPVIMMVTTPTEEAERRSHAMSACAVITKPVLLRDLNDAIQECLSSSKAPLLRRRHIRVNADVNVTVNYKGQDLDLVTKTISAGGAFIRYEQTLPVGELVDIFMPIGDNERLRLAGKVLYNHMPGKSAFGICPGFAIEFYQPGMHEVEAIEELVLRLVAEDIIGSQAEEYLAKEEPKGRPGLPSKDSVYSGMRKYLEDQD